MFLSEDVVRTALAVLEFVIIIEVILIDCEYLISSLVGVHSLGLRRSTLVLYCFDYLDLVVRMGLTQILNLTSLFRTNWYHIYLLLHLVFNILLS